MPKDLFADSQCLVIILFYQKIICCGYSVCHKFCRPGPFQATFSPDPDKPQTRLNQTFPGPQCDGTRLVRNTIDSRRFDATGRMYVELLF